MLETITKYIICGPTRCAGHLVNELIQSVGMESHRTHDMQFTLGDDINTGLVMIDRVDVFSAVLSTAICHRTGQTTHYDNKYVEPFAVDAGWFERMWQEHLAYRQGYQHHRSWARIDLFWYEEVTSEPWCVLDRLKLRHLPKVRDIFIEPAPYNYKDIVTNWQELRTMAVKNTWM